MGMTFIRPVQQRQLSAIGFRILNVDNGPKVPTYSFYKEFQQTTHMQLIYRRFQNFRDAQVKFDKLQVEMNQKILNSWYEVKTKENRINCEQ